MKFGPITMFSSVRENFKYDMFIGVCKRMLGYFITVYLQTAADIFFYGWLVWKDFKLYGSLLSNQINLHGWLVFRCVEGEERLLSAKKKERSFIKSSQKKALSLANRRGHLCLYAIIKPWMFPSNIGKKRYRNKLPNSGFCSGHYFTWETCIFRRIY